MNLRYLLIAFTCASLSTLASAMDRPDGPPPGGQGPQGGPPKEAITACAGKSEGAAASMTTPRGDTVVGTCTSIHGTLALMPKDHRGGPQGGQPPRRD